MSWYSGLNPEQVEAVKHDLGPLLILAGAGSGKTTVLVSRAGRLIEEKIVTPESLCVLTFTNRAARELKERVSKKLGSKGDKMWAGTFHSFGLRILKKYHKQAGLSRDFGILDPGDGTLLVKELLQDFKHYSKSNFDGEKLLSKISEWRESGQTKAKMDEEYEEAVEWLLPRYTQRIQALGMVDFDTLIIKPLELMKEHPEIRNVYSQVMVDEFQDTSRMQMRFIDALVVDHKNLTVVGDDDQSIYGWRGAFIKNILDFPKRYAGCRVVRLVRNYRSTPEILALANAVIAKNKDRHVKELVSEGKSIGKLPESLAFDDEAEEVENICLEARSLFEDGYKKKDIAVLYRSNQLGAMLEVELRKQQIPYNISGGMGFFDRKEVRDILALIRSLYRPNEVSVKRVLHCMPRGIGDKSMADLTQKALDQSKSFVAIARNWQSEGVEPPLGAKLDSFFGELDQLKLQLSQASAATIQSVLVTALDQGGYKKHLEKISANSLAANNRWKMVEMFGDILSRYLTKNGNGERTVLDFLESMELRDHASETEEKDELQLLTLHACKGLEFPVVIFMGVEEDIIPHKRLGSDISEERRLFYVGVTRAKERLILTRSKRRKKHGKLEMTPPSRFLLEIPEKLIVERTGGREVREDVRKAMIADLFKKIASTPSPKLN